jgi:hypothetical protein
MKDKIARPKAAVVFPATGIVAVLAWAVSAFTDSELDANTAIGLTAVLTFIGAWFAPNSWGG